MTSAEEYNEGRRVSIRVGEVVKVKGLRGLFTVKEFRKGASGWEAHLYGGPVNHEKSRTVTADRLIRKRTQPEVKR